MRHRIFCPICDAEMKKISSFEWRCPKCLYPLFSPKTEAKKNEVSEKV